MKATAHIPNLAESPDAMIALPDLLKHASRTRLVGFAILDPHLRITHANDRFTDFTRTSVSACLGRKLETVAPQFSRRLTTMSRRALASDADIAEVLAERYRQPGDEHRRNWLVMLSPIYDETGEPSALACFVQDAEPDLLARQSLEKRPHFETFLSGLSAHFVSVPIDQVGSAIQTGLHRLVEFLGVDRACLVSPVSREGSAMVLGSYSIPGVPALMPMQPFEGLAEMKWYAGELREGRIIRMGRVEDIPTSARAERKFWRSQGLKSSLGIPIKVAGLPLCSLGVATFHYKHSFPDSMLPRLRLIGEVFANAVSRWNADRQLQTIRDELSHVARVSTVGQLAASIAHEINQPLAAMQFNAQAASRLLGSPNIKVADVRAALRDIISDGKRAASVVSKAHALLKRRPMEFMLCSLNDVVKDVTLLLHSDALIRRVALRTQLSDDLPMVTGDRVQLQQVVMNLIVNAMDAALSVKEKKPAVVVTTQDGATGVQVAVSDNGPGLDPETLEKMFQPFYTTKTNGLGMGLAINREIIEVHGGKIWAFNHVPRGATVTFVLQATDDK